MTPMVQRTTVVDTPSIIVEILRCTLGRDRTPATHTDRRQVMFPLAGTFYWHVGASTSLCDPNQVMFVETDEESCDTVASPGEVTCLLATLRDEPRDARNDDAFRRRVARTSPALQARYAWFAAAVANRRDVEPALWEEHALAIVGRATRDATSMPTPRSTAASELAARTKEILADRGRLLRLGELADRLEVSPAYLTDAFRRAEGIPVVRYQLQLRLMRALRELPHANDLTRLALELGFSSHSHFSTAFRAATGLTPSRYRASARSGTWTAIESFRKRGAMSVR